MLRFLKISYIRYCCNLKFTVSSAVMRFKLAYDFMKTISYIIKIRTQPKLRKDSFFNV